MNITDADEHLQDRAEERKSGLDLLLRVIGLDRRGDNDDAESVGAHGVSGRHHCDVDIYARRQKVPNGHKETIKV